MPGSFAEFPLASDKFHLHCAHMGQFLQDRENGQNVAFFWNSALTKQFEFFNLSQFLRRHMPVRFKNVFVLVLAHLEPELELLDDIGDDCDDVL